MREGFSSWFVCLSGRDKLLRSLTLAGYSAYHLLTTNAISTVWILLKAYKSKVKPVHLTVSSCILLAHRLTSRDVTISRQSDLFHSCVIKIEVVS